MKSGFVSILGRPNAGKSTLLNRLVGAKIAIVSDKPQTTRELIQGVLTRSDAQIVFLDSPGIHEPRNSLNRRMMRQVKDALEARDLLLLLVDATARFGAADERAVELIRSSRTPALLLLNKIDRLERKEFLLPLIDRYRTLHPFEEYLPISALTGEGTEEVIAAVIARLPEGPQYFPPDHLTDQPLRQLSAEIVREKVLQVTREEVPHAVAIGIDLFEESPRLVRVAATIYVERSGQKGIIIGTSGQHLKQIGTAAREELEGLLGRKVFLALHVKVRPDWRESESFLEALDWRRQLGREL
jgi:GTP-binding protein Era